MLQKIAADIRALVTQKFYPCVAAVQSVAKNDMLIENASGFGTGQDREKIRAAMLTYLENWKKNRSTTYTLWIAYPDSSFADEDSFEQALWSELSHLTSVEERDTDWAEGWSKNPEDRNFTFCIGGSAFFVVGLHPHSSRLGRKFPYPSLIFNVFDQFEDLEAEGAYAPMVAKNRERDIRFQGDVNPMVDIHGDRWESIQFSGKKNDTAWKCPFAFLHRKKDQGAASVGGSTASAAAVSH